MTAVHLGKHHIHQVIPHLLGWTSTKLLDGRQTGLAVLPTPQGIRWFRLTPAAPAPEPPSPELLPCTAAESELLLLAPKLEAYDRHRGSGLPGVNSFAI
ncbi:hypothetical protein ADK64_20705 [Streptomyces sp. MMG1121]|nr:hypothetical protein ADK64_20705 [Streptomyces sp. MMG1121]